MFLFDVNTYGTAIVFYSVETVAVKGYTQESNSQIIEHLFPVSRTTSVLQSSVNSKAQLGVGGIGHFGWVSKFPFQRPVVNSVEIQHCFLSELISRFALWQRYL